MMLVECKWASKPVGSNVLANLERKANLVRAELQGRGILYGLCSRSGFTDQLQADVQKRQDVMLFDLPTIIG